MLFSLHLSRWEFQKDGGRQEPDNSGGGWKQLNGTKCCFENGDGREKSMGRRKRNNVLCCAKLLQSCPTVCNHLGCSPPGSSVHGILQARVLEWVAVSFSRGSSLPRDGTQVSYWQLGSLPLAATWETRRNDGGHQKVLGPESFWNRSFQISLSRRNLVSWTSASNCLLVCL